MGNLYISQKNNFRQAFTIVELIIVIAVIGILVTISTFAYNGIQAGAHDKSVLSDLDEMDSIQTDYGLKNGVVGKAYYSGDGFDNDLSFTPGAGNVIDVVINSTDYCIRGYNLVGTKDSITNAAIKESSTGVCASISPSPAAFLGSGGSSGSLICPSGFIIVPGNSTFSTSDFCTMKYEAKITGNDNGVQIYSASFVPESRASGTPWINISQTNALIEASTVAGCTGCHLITENEWLTIAHNVLNVPSNWSSGTVGTGYIYSGHNDNGPANALAADSNDSNGYIGTGQSGTSSQRRTLTLSNGEVIWDMAGNVHDWTSGTIGANQQPGLSGETAYAIKQWNNASLIMNGLPASAKPSYGTPAASGWTTSHGIGQLYSNYGETGARAFLRGGAWPHGGFAGVFCLSLDLVPSNTSTAIGFRASR